MMKKLPQLILFMGAILLILASAKAECVKSVFVFGDSQLDPGNNPYVENCIAQANFPPYGLSFFKNPTGRFSDGRTVMDFIAQFLGIEFQKPFQELAHGKLNDFPPNGINFASGGSGVLPNTNKGAGVTSLQAQLQQFQDLVDQNRIEKEQIENSLFFLESGSNDVFDYYTLRNTSKPQDYVQYLLKEVDQFINTIYKLGARRIAIFSIGPMGCVPARINLVDSSKSQCIEELNKMSEDFNAGLELLVNDLSKKYPDTVGTYGAVYNIVQNIFNNSELQGFNNINDACCGGGVINGMLQCGLEGYNMCSNRSEYFFWDYFHPSERAYGLLAEALWAGNNDQIRPMNLKTLACPTTPSLS